MQARKAERTGSHLTKNTALISLPQNRSEVNSFRGSACRGGIECSGKGGIFLARVIYKFGGTSVGDTAAVPRGAASPRPTAPGTRSSPCSRRRRGNGCPACARAGDRPGLRRAGGGQPAVHGRQVSVSLCALALALSGCEPVRLADGPADGLGSSARVLGAATASSGAAGRRVVLAAGFRGAWTPPGILRSATRRFRYDGGRAGGFLHTPISAVSIRMSTASMTVIRACIPTP